jgi:Rad3-related DNA helicase
MELRSHFPYKVIRSFQDETLRLLEERWDNYDVFVIVAPTAYGKSALARTLMGGAYSASYIVPTNQLVDQFLSTFPDSRTLRRMDSYFCEKWRRPCPKTKALLKNFCNGCQCGKDVAQAKYRNGPGVYTYHAYLAHRLYRDVLIVDEAHQLLPMLQSMGEVVLWQHDYKYPSSAYRPPELLRWAESLPKKKKEGAKLGLLLENLRSRVPEYAVSRQRRDFNGKGTKRGEPEERDCIVLTPLSAREHSGKMWPGVKKIILMSATINFKDIEALGLSDRRVAYIHSPSPIPAERRPFIVDDIVTVSYSNLSPATETMATYIRDILYPRHVGERGLIHATYSMSQLLRNWLVGPQYLFHDRENKKEVYQRYLSTPGAVLIACGMHEGIDLPDDAGRWQVILKVPWPSLGDPAIAALAKRDEEWYVWQTAKTLIQAGGRVSRHEADFGVTYCLDGTFMRLYNNGQHLLPHWFTDCLVDGKAAQ